MTTPSTERTVVDLHTLLARFSFQFDDFGSSAQHTSAKIPTQSSDNSESSPPQTSLKHQPLPEALILRSDTTWTSHIAQLASLAKCLRTFQLAQQNIIILTSFQVVLLVVVQIKLRYLHVSREADLMITTYFGSNILRLV